MRKIDAAILDVDGTLIDSNHAHAMAWSIAFEQHSYSVPYTKIKKLIGKGGDKLIKELVDVDSNSEKGKKILEFKRSIFNFEFLPNLVVFPRALELLKRMREYKLRLAVASSSNREELDHLLNRIGAKTLIECALSQDDVKNSKPDPDLVFIALEKLGTAPSRTLMLGDTPFDIQAAAQTEVQTVALRCGGWDDYSLRDAIAIFNDPEELFKEFKISPFFPG